jgi:hypothetical protein
MANKTISARDGVADITLRVEVSKEETSYIACASDLDISRVIGSSCLVISNNGPCYATGTEKCSCAMHSLPEASRCMTCVARTVSNFSDMRLPPTSRPVAWN